MEGFTQTSICTSRANCYQCRNNEHFRKQMEDRYGKWECPEGLPIGVELNELPEKSQKAYNHMIEVQEQRKKNQEEVSVALDELQMVIPEDSKHLINKIRNLVLPQSKTPDKCKHGGKQIGEVDQECCGGKIEKKPAFHCDMHTITTGKKCTRCLDFEGK